MKGKLLLVALLLLVISVATAGFVNGKTNPKEALDKYFTSAMAQDYVTTYGCYCAAYQAKVTEEEYVKHRKEASLLQSYKIISLKKEGGVTQAEVELTFGPSEKLKRNQPVTVTVKEDLVKEGRGWKIKI